MKVVSNVRGLSPFADDVNKAHVIHSIQSFRVKRVTLFHFDHNRLEKQSYYWLFDIMYEYSYCKVWIFYTHLVLT